MNQKELLDIVFRYALILLLGMKSLSIYYWIFTPLTFNFSAFLLSLFGTIKVFPNLGIIIFNKTSIEIINACIAGSAYYLFTILIFSTRDIRLKKRLNLVIISFSSLLIFNSIRIAFMGLIAGERFFDTAHWFFWYFISIFFVCLAWFGLVKKFKINSIPFHSDFKFLLKQKNVR